MSNDKYVWYVGQRVGWWELKQGSRIITGRADVTRITNRVVILDDGHRFDAATGQRPRNDWDSVREFRPVEDSEFLRMETQGFEAACHRNVAAAAAAFRDDPGPGRAEAIITAAQQWKHADRQAREAARRH